MRPEDFDVQKIISSLQGTCNSLQSALDDYYPGMDDMELTSDDYSAIDNEIFLCDECGWWCETREQSEGGFNICQDCEDSNN